MACPRLAGTIVCPVPSRLRIEQQNTSRRHAEWETALATGRLQIPEYLDMVSKDQWFDVEEFDDVSDNAPKDKKENKPSLDFYTELAHWYESSAGDKDDDWTSCYSGNESPYPIPGYYANAGAKTVSSYNSYGSDIFADREDFLSDGSFPQVDTPTHKPARANYPTNNTATESRRYWLSKDVRVVIKPRQPQNHAPAWHNGAQSPGASFVVVDGECADCVFDPEHCAKHKVCAMCSYIRKPCFKHWGPKAPKNSRSSGLEAATVKPEEQADRKPEMQAGVHRVDFAKPWTKPMKGNQYGSLQTSSGDVIGHRRDNTLQILMRSSASVVPVKERIRRVEAAEEDGQLSGRTGGQAGKRTYL